MAITFWKWYKIVSKGTPYLGLKNILTSFLILIVPFLNYSLALFLSFFSFRKTDQSWAWQSFRKWSWNSSWKSWKCDDTVWHQWWPRNSISGVCEVSPPYFTSYFIIIQSYVTVLHANATCINGMSCKIMKNYSYHQNMINGTKPFIDSFFLDILNSFCKSIELEFWIWIWMY